VTTTTVPLGLLTPREAEVISLAAQGLTDAQIARRLHLSLRTVNTHMHNLRRRLQVTSRTAAVVLAVAYGLIQPDLPTPPTWIQPLDLDSDQEDAKQRALWEDLAAAGPVGVRVAVLACRIGRSRGYVYYHLRQWAQAGYTEPLGPGRWRALPLQHTPCQLTAEWAG
jgi:DNA-binding CsgD family transcriptional regulator